VSKRTALYRHWDAEGQLLYVGISLSAVQRLAQHKAGSHWSDSINKVTIEYFENREAAHAAERAAVQSENPLHNIQMKSRAQAKVEEVQQLHWLSRLNLAQTVAGFNPMYLVPDAANKCGVTQSVFRLMMAAAGVEPFTIPEDPRLVKREYVTGWQVMYTLECAETHTAKAA